MKQKKPNSTTLHEAMRIAKAIERDIRRIGGATVKTTIKGGGDNHAGKE